MAWWPLFHIRKGSIVWMLSCCLIAWAFSSHPSYTVMYQCSITCSVNFCSFSLPIMATWQKCYAQSATVPSGWYEESDTESSMNLCIFFLHGAYNEINATGVVLMVGSRVNPVIHNVSNFFFFRGNKSRQSQSPAWSDDGVNDRGLSI